MMSHIWVAMLSEVFELHQMLVIYLKIAKICIINFEWSEKKKKANTPNTVMTITTIVEVFTTISIISSI